MLVLSVHKRSRKPGCLRALDSVYKQLTCQAFLHALRNVAEGLATFVTPQHVSGIRHHKLL